ncbi:MAG: C40 family peptidase [Coriobacteriales bacterium]|jgi:cell wall-associated NlpC family hydrolase|nr:C40 family peptidase [Coriobacteriales bacterium]
MTPTEADMQQTSVHQSDTADKASITRRNFAFGIAAAFGVGAITALNTQLGTSFGARLAFADPTSAEKQAEADAVAAQLSAWAKELQTASDNYSYAMDAHDAAIVQMNEAQGRIDVAQEAIFATQTKLGSRASSMYKSGPLSFLDVLFGASSFEDFTTRWELLNSINRENAALIAQNKTARKEAEDAREIFMAQERIAAEKLAEAKAIKANAEELVAKYEAELAGLEAEVAELVRKEQEAEAARLAAEEAARLAAEEAARNASNSNSSAGSGGGGGFWGDGSTSHPVGTYNSIVEAAYSRLGCPYVWAGNGPEVFDCSGLTRWCYAQVGISIPRTDSSQRAAASSVLPVDQAQPGDILWMSGHVGIAIGGGSYIHAPYPGGVVCIDSWPIFSAALRY